MIEVAKKLLSVGVPTPPKVISKIGKAMQSRRNRNLGPMRNDGNQVSNSLNSTKCPAKGQKITLGSYSGPRPVRERGPRPVLIAYHGQARLIVERSAFKPGFA